MTSRLSRQCLVSLVLMASGWLAQAETIVMASTTSTEQSGLFAHLLPAFTKATGVEVKVVALGTGQAIDMGRRGDADVLFVHDQVAEEKVVAEGFAVKRFPVMYNDFVLIGPASDPAKTKGDDNNGNYHPNSIATSISNHIGSFIPAQFRNAQNEYSKQ